MKNAREIAKSRLELMLVNNPLEQSVEQYEQMKIEIAKIASKYICLSPEEYEIRLILKQKKES